MDRKIGLRNAAGMVECVPWLRLWWNWQTRYFEVVVGKPVQVQVLLSAPLFLSKMKKTPIPAQIAHRIPHNPKAARCNSLKRSNTAT